ncbi:hypothetical protein [Ruegeria arenilitoris]|uniref:hypothetical protein n=1 Tax=Ruegeria arenilitoris TaxID=1173585 RepID=UPI00147F5573|nr:hypothetical protein [Ruegeria arenilitoris]
MQPLQWQSGEGMPGKPGHSFGDRAYLVQGFRASRGLVVSQKPQNAALSCIRSAHLY